MSVASSSTLSVFADLLTKYPTWSDLKPWLAANESQIDVVETEGSPYVILRNTRERDDKDESKQPEDETLSDVSQACRSVVWDTVANRPCCVAPFAARRDQKIPLNSPLKLEDFVEGVMINVFRSKGDSETHVASRSRIDAGGKFYSEKSFRELFDEALAAKDSSLADLERLLAAGATGENVQASFFSLVLAHPEHRVVRSVDQANLWIIYRGNVLNDGTVEFFTEDLPDSWVPKRYSNDLQVAEWSELKAKFDEIRSSKPWHWQGIVVYSASGSGAQRWRFRNGSHDRVRRDLRGTESNALGRFLRLRAEKRVQEYLRVYPEDNEAFQEFERDYRASTKTLYAWYCRCHKEHSIAFKALPKSVQPLIFELHKFYLGTLRPQSKSLRLTEIISWITEYFKAPFGVSNMLRFMKEAEQPPASKAAFPELQVAAGDAATPAVDDEEGGAELGGRRDALPSASDLKPEMAVAEAAYSAVAEAAYSAVAEAAYSAVAPASPSRDYDQVV